MSASGSVSALQRLALLGKDVLLNSRLGLASTQLNSLRSFEASNLTSTFSSSWSWQNLPGLQRIVSLVPSLADVQLWAVPKRKVNISSSSWVPVIIYSLNSPANAIS